MSDGARIYSVEIDRSERFGSATEKVFSVPDQSFGILLGLFDDGGDKATLSFICREGEPSLKQIRLVFLYTDNSNMYRVSNPTNIKYLGSYNEELVGRILVFEDLEFGNSIQGMCR